MADADYSHGPIGGMPQPLPYQPTAHNTAPEKATGNSFLSTEQPAYPGWLKFLPVAILILALGVIAMVGYVAHEFNSGTESLGFNLFAGSWTLIVGTYLILAFFFMPHIHFRWIILILSAISCIWWLTAFAYLASNTRQVYQIINYINQYSGSFGGSSYYGYKGKFKRDVLMFTESMIVGSGLQKRQFSTSDLSSLSGLLSAFNTLKTVAAVMAGAAGIGAIVWLLFMAFTIFYAISMFRGSPSPGAGAANYEPKVEMQPYNAQAPAYQPPVSAEGYAPAKPEGAAIYDPRMTPGTEFMTPPPPPGTNQPTGMTYVNPQFGAGQPYTAVSEPDRNYTVSPLSISEVQGSEPSARVEMPAHR
ncbi:hypothetical protein H072_3295 [Dactylellina haptotyla CBS 200.50]|uniref:MARVEL domain-containing protein n=1 Tax=Dactylellina haptotyla (strain CBS 200.50) TaxID=1284197 RepID=S8C4P1_DACHA|nr:hypothetical protein H072_3295 [Dactylellina haptotyla CBS 200.50]